MHEGKRAELLQVPDSILVENLVDIGVGVQVSGVVRGVDGDRDTSAVLESVALEQTLGGRWGSADGESHGAHSADVCMSKGRHLLLLVEGSDGIPSGTLRDAGDDGRPCLLGGRSLLKCLLGCADAGACAESDADSFCR